MQTSGSQAETPVSPPDDDLIASIKVLRAGNPSLGASKLLASLLASHPNWTLSEKRLRKVLQREGLGLPNPAIKGDPTNKTTAGLQHPISQLNDDLKLLDRWTKKAQVKVFDELKGKGLVCVDEIKEGEVIWKEDPWIYFPAEWAIHAQQTSLPSVRCAHCAMALPSPKSPPISCEHGCSNRWCTRLCASRAKAQHGFLCSEQNPAFVPLMKWIVEQKWIAIGAWMRVVALLLGEWASGGETPGEGKSWRVLRSLAALSLRERVKVLPNWQASAASDEAIWKKAHSLLVQAFDKPADAAHLKKLTKLKKNKVLPPGIAEELFGYEGFLVGLGKMSLNVEAHGGIYALHSHLNHSCTPNVSVRHLDPELGRITLIAKRGIEVGEELVVSYVNPSDGVRKRRRELKEWGFGECDCPRCVEESGKIQGDEEEEKKADLEDELRGFLGV